MRGSNTLAVPCRQRPLLLRRSYRYLVESLRVHTALCKLMQSTTRHMMKSRLILLLLTMLPAMLCGQHIQQHQLEGKHGVGFGSGETFSPFKDNRKDSTKQELNVPKEIHQWRIGKNLGEPVSINADTLQYMFQNWHLTEGPNGEYNFLGNMGTPRQSRIFFNRPTTTSYNFLQPYDYFYTRLSSPTPSRHTRISAITLQETKLMVTTVSEPISPPMPESISV